MKQKNTEKIREVIKMGSGMNWLNFFRGLYHSNKKLFVISFLIIAALVIVGCTTGQGSAPPPSGPIGGGCG